MNKTRENSPCWCVWGQIKWDGYQGRKENVSDPRGFGPTDAGNSGEQTVYWKCKSTWKLGLFYQAKRYSHVTDIVGGQICFYNALGFVCFFFIFNMMAIISKEEKYETLNVCLSICVCLGYEEKLWVELLSPGACSVRYAPAPAPGMEGSRCLTRTVLIWGENISFISMCSCALSLKC